MRRRVKSNGSTLSVGAITGQPLRAAVGMTMNRVVVEGS